MIRGLIAALLLASSAQALSDDCYYYWTHQCVEVVDASKRQLRQSVLVSPAINYLNSNEQSCKQAATARHQAVMTSLLSAFNGEAEKIKACDAPLSDVSLRVYDNPQKATWHYNRTTRDTDNKTVIRVDNLPLL